MWTKHVNDAREAAIMPTLAPAVSLLARAIGVTARLRVLFRARSVPCQQVGLCALSILHKLNLGYRHGDPRESQTPANPAVTVSIYYALLWCYPDSFVIVL